MAAAETARLIASLELQDKNFTRGIRNVERGVGRVDKKLSAFGGFVNRNLARGIDSFGGQPRRWRVRGRRVAARNWRQQQAQTTAVIKSTGGVAGVSAEEIRTSPRSTRDSTRSWATRSSVRGENMLLTFTNITEDAFEPALGRASST